MSAELQMAVVVAVLLATFLCFIKEWIPAELAALAAFATLLATAILDEDDVGRVFSNTAPIVIGAMFILSAALTRTGLIDLLAAQFSKAARGSELRALGILALIVIPASAFLNNTPVVVVFLPVIIATCHNTGFKATRLLLPLSFFSILGGTTTLVGTSTNLLVAGVARDAGQPAFTIFEITVLGVVYAIVGTAYLLIVGRRLLPARDTVSSTLTVEDTRRFYSALEVEPGSPLVGQRLVDSPLLAGNKRLAIYQAVRRGAPLSTPLGELEVQGGDVFWFRGSTKEIARIQAVPGVRLLRRHRGPDDVATAAGSPAGESDTEGDIRSGEVRLVEAIIGPDSSLIGKTVRRAALRQRFGILVAALHRRGRNLREGFENIPMEFGDTLILEGPTSNLMRFHQEDDILSLQDLDVAPRQTRKVAIAVLTLLGVVLCSAFGALSITTAALIGAVVVILTGCLDVKTAFAAIEFKILFLIYGMLGVGRAMEKTGVAQHVAEAVTSFLEPAGPIVILAGIYLMASLLTEVVTNNAVAIILTPIVIGIAVALEMNPRPFIVAVMFGASASFLTPIGYQTNTYVYGAGNYLFRDFVKIGLPLNLLLGVIATILIPCLWPF
ncbi:MAG TPA: SLC13 family permease [Verrucomicrobiales bacterium]|nr:SLC13 family permease [Verrucomicrobiales bacterium]